MRRELGISLGFLALCAATLAPKLLLRPGSPEPDLVRLHGDLRTMFEGRGYAVSLVDRKYVLDHVVATRGACRLAVTYAKPGGSEQILFGQLQRGMGRMRFYYRGAWTAENPRIQPVFEAFLQRLFAQLGASYSYPPVLMVVATPSCDLDSLPWAYMRIYSRKLSA